jgi:hypothetical protein
MAIEKFLCDQSDAIQQFQLNQNNNSILLQFEQTTALRELQFKHDKDLLNFFTSTNTNTSSNTSTNTNTSFNTSTNINLNLYSSKAIKNLHNIKDDNIRKLEFKHMKAIHKLHFINSNAISKSIFKHIKGIELLQYKEAEIYFNCMIKNVKKIILETRQNDYNLTQEHLNLSIKKISNKISDNDEYSEYIKNNQIVQIVILLYLMKKNFVELDLDSIPNFVLNNSRLQYFTIVFSKLKITKLIINDDNNRLLISLELIKLLLLLPNLKVLKLQVIKSNKDFELPDQKLQINDLELSMNNIWNDENRQQYYPNYSKNNITYFDNILTFIKMCPNLQKLNLNINYLIINNENLAKLTEILQCYNLTDLTLNNFEYDDFENNDKNEELHFEYLIGQCHYLTNLNLEYNCIQSEEAKKIAKIVSKSKTITHFNLSNNNIQNQTIFDIVEIISTCNSLSHLNLSYNFSGNDDQKDRLFREIELQIPMLDLEQLTI